MKILRMVSLLAVTFSGLATYSYASSSDCLTRAGMLLAQDQSIYELCEEGTKADAGLGLLDSCEPPHTAEYYANQCKSEDKAKTVTSKPQTDDLQKQIASLKAELSSCHADKSTEQLAKEVQVLEQRVDALSQANSGQAH